MFSLSNALTLTISLANFILGAFVLAKGRKKALNISFAIFSFIAAFWILSNFIFTIKPSLFIMESQYAFGTSVMPAALIWMYFLIEKRISPIKFTVIIIIALSIFFLTYFNGLVLQGIEKTPEGGYSLTLGPLFDYYSIFILFFYVFIIYKLISGLRKSSGPVKTQLKYILTGTLIFGGISMIVDFILPFFDIVPVAAYDAQSSFFFVAFSTYAITKHHLFNIKVVATELLVGLVAIVLFTDLLLSKSILAGLVKAEILVVFIYLGISLIKSVLKEIELRERIKRAYEVEKEARKQVEELTEAKTQFIMATQHHLRTPLTSMIGYLDLLFGGTYGKVPPKIKETLLKFQVSTRRLIRVVNALLDISQFQMGKRVVALEPGVDFESLIKEVMEELRFEVKIRGLYFKYEKIGAVSAIKADSEKLKVALFNIIDNAIKYTKQGGITVSLKQVGKSVQLSIRDTGIGVDPKQSKKLFKEVFARGKEAKKVHGFGRGIGVYITGHIIRAHNGRIWAESQGKGKGTCFFIELPVG